MRLAFSCLLVWLLYRSIDIRQVVNILKEVEPLLLIIAFALNYMGSITVQSQITRKSSTTLCASLWELDKVNLAMRLYAMIVPMAAVSVIRWRRYTLLGASKSHSLLLMIQNKVLQILFITLCLLIPLVFYQDVFQRTLGLETFYLLMVAIFAICLVCMFVLGVIVGWVPAGFFFSILFRIAEGLPVALRSRVLRVSESFRNSLNEDHRLSHKTLLILLSLALLGHVLVLCSQYVVTLAIGMEINLLVLAFSRSFVQLALMLPVTVAGIGAREFGFISTLAIFSVGAESATALSLILLAFQVTFAWLGILVEGSLALRGSRIF